ncbi:MAG: DUF2097 domain-containing protein [Methanosphaera sp.]|uniref:DUF2097 domain-containing protein n=1 Tax=Methanosphaera sp. TaxID=2666342 RepID=UPI002E764F17|nr:DUF2097 domain-containing protein [Methanosphaera sp.]MEE1117276.1 DUF2097 domain-containing protein [Methanosphaera sp.]MEE3323747.1 DUF2097 domain-containing protein [Methanosphaera sp.]MEE3419180.1 DUF2097 domain-containing protein [Methanosphaera sp.]
MNKKHIVLKEDELEDYILKNFKEDAFLEISYNRVFIPGKILYIDDDASITLQLKGQLLNQRVDIDISEVKKELVEIIYTSDEESVIITITN